LSKLRALELTTLAAAGGLLLALAITTDGSVDPRYVVALGVLIILGEHSSVLLPRSSCISPSFTVIMASVAIFGSQDATVLSTALVGAFAGLYWPHIRQLKLPEMGFNCGQYVLSSAAAAFAYQALPSAAGPWIVPAVLLTAAAFAVVNTTLVVPAVALHHDERPRMVLAQMLPAFPNYLAFGMLGLIVGELASAMGLAVVALLLLPMLIGRYTYSSLLKIRDAHEATIGIFIRLIEAKDPYTAGHTERVAKYSQYIAEELDLPPTWYEHLRHSALMHDVGKLAVPNRLLNKPGKLTEEEFAVVRQHNDVCINILGRVDFMRTMAVTASDKHGRFEDASEADPANQLVLEAHIVAVADSFDAMTSTRSYRKALAQDVAFAELRRCAGTQFNPDCVEALIRAIEKRDEHYGAGHEEDVHEFAVTPPEAGVGSAGLGDLQEEADITLPRAEVGS
jgi:hypothetical protein